jgi:hypothetical protein
MKTSAAHVIPGATTKIVAISIIQAEEYTSIARGIVARFPKIANNYFCYFETIEI